MYNCSTCRYIVTGKNPFYVTEAKMLLHKIDPFQRNTHTLIWLFYLCTGEGQYGKLYSAVNMDNSELMAMKEVIYTFIRKFTSMILCAWIF